MQVFGLPSHCIRDAVARWRWAMADGLTGESAARAVGRGAGQSDRGEVLLDRRLLKLLAYRADIGCDVHRLDRDQLIKVLRSPNGRASIRCG